MASTIPHQLLISSTDQNNALFFSPDYNICDQFSGGSSAVPNPGSREEIITGAMWNNCGDYYCTGENFSSENIGICDGVVPDFPPEYLNNTIIVNNGVVNNNNNIPVGAQSLLNYGLECNYNNNGSLLLLDQFQEPFPQDFNPLSFLEEQNNNNWGIMQSSTQMMNGTEEPNIMKVGRYSEEERKERIVRYLKKRNQRNFNKTIKYACRKTLADRRVRVRGRFARNNKECDNDQKIVAENIIIHDDDLTRKEMQLCRDDSLQMIKCENDEDWLQDFTLCWVNGESNINNYCI